MVITCWTGIHEPLATTWSKNWNFRRLHSVLEGLRWSQIWSNPSPTYLVTSNRHQHRCIRGVFLISSILTLRLKKIFLKTRLWKIRIWRMLYLHLLRHQLIMNLFNIRLAQTRIIVSITLKDYKKLLVDISPNSCENTLQS